MLASLFHSRTNLDKFSRKTCPVQLFRELYLTHINLMIKKVWKRSIASELSILTRLKIFDVLCHHFWSVHRNLTLSIRIGFACTFDCPVHHSTFEWYLQANQTQFSTSHIRLQVLLTSFFWYKFGLWFTFYNKM